MTKPNKFRGALLKLLGTFTILLAVGIQYFWYDHWKDQAEIGGRLLLDAEAAEKKLERAKALYMPEGLGQDALWDYLMSVRSMCEYAGCRSRVANASALPLSHRELGSLLETVRTRSQLDAFLQAHASALSGVREAAASHLAFTTDRQRRLRTLFAIVYLFGSLFLVVGLIFELRGVHE